MRLRRYRRHHNGSAPGVLCHGATGRLLSSIRKAASPLWHTGKRDSSADRPRAGRAFLGAFDRVLSYIIFSAVIFLALAGSTLFRLRSRLKDGGFRRPYHFIVLSTLIAMLILLHDPVPALIGVAIVLCGIPFRRFLLPRQASMSVVQAP